MDTVSRPTKSCHHSTYERISSLHGFDGTGKTVLITGGPCGIGYPVFRAFAEAGAKRVVLVYRSMEALARTKEQLEKAYPDVKILTYQASITDYQRIQSIFNELGTMDILMLNAAITHHGAVATDIDVGEIREAFEVNVVSAFFIAKTYLTMSMPSVKTKTIINVSAGTAHMINRVGNGASKAAAAQFKEGNVKIVSFHPGTIYTSKGAQNLPKNVFPWDDEELPADFALWLAGPESNFLHGRHVWAQWDVDELIALKDKIEDQPDFLTIGLVQ